MRLKTADRLQVRYVGSGATERWWSLRQRAADEIVVRGEVTAVHDSVIYIRFHTHEYQDGQALVVGCCDLRAGPLLSRVDSQPEFSFKHTGLSGGSKCWVTVDETRETDVIKLKLDNELIICVDTDTLSMLPVGNRASKYECESITRADPVWTSSNDLLSWLVTTDHRDGLAWLPELAAHSRTTNSARVSALTTEVITALNSGLGDPPQAEVATRLVGRGPGSTPAGDDLLSGLLVTLYSLGGVYRTQVALYGERLLSLAENRTTTRSVMFLEQAVQGRATSPVNACLNTLLQPSESSEENMRECAEAVCEHGHTSGVATMAGVLTAILAVLPQLK